MAFATPRSPSSFAPLQAGNTFCPTSIDYQGAPLAFSRSFSVLPTSIRSNLPAPPQQDPPEPRRPVGRPEPQAANADRFAEHVPEVHAHDLPIAGRGVRAFPRVGTLFLFVLPCVTGQRIPV